MASTTAAAAVVPAAVAAAATAAEAVAAAAAGRPARQASLPSPLPPPPLLSGVNTGGRSGGGGGGGGGTGSCGVGGGDGGRGSDGGNARGGGGGLASAPSSLRAVRIRTSRGGRINVVRWTTSAAPLLLACHACQPPPSLPLPYLRHCRTGLRPPLTNVDATAAVMVAAAANRDVPCRRPRPVPGLVCQRLAAAPMRRRHPARGCALRQRRHARGRQPRQRRQHRWRSRRRQRRRRRWCLGVCAAPSARLQGSPLPAAIASAPSA